MVVALFGLLLLLSADEVWVRGWLGFGHAHDLTSGTIVRWCGLGMMVLAGLHVAGLIRSKPFVLATVVAGSLSFGAVLWVLLFIVGDGPPGDILALWNWSRSEAAPPIWTPLLGSLGAIVGAALAARADRAVERLPALTALFAVFLAFSTVMPWASDASGAMKLGLRYDAGATTLVFALLVLIVTALRLGKEVGRPTFVRFAAFFSAIAVAMVVLVFIDDIGRAYDPKKGSGLLGLYNLNAAYRVQAEPGIYLALTASMAMLAANALAVLSLSTPRDFWPPPRDLIRRIVRTMRYAVPGTMPPR